MLKLSAPDFLFENVDDQEEPDPDDVHEVPVVRDHDCAGCFAVTEVLDGERTSDDKKEGDETTGHVEAVEPGCDVERGSIGVRG